MTPQGDVRILRTDHGGLAFGPRTLVVGILNVTPDSFSDGGQFANASDAVRHGLQMAADGADLIDIGGESTRPGSDPVPPGIQIDRVLPVITALRADGLKCPISIDTQSAEVARSALEAGADIVNDISAAQNDPAMAGLLAQCGAPLILMHMQGTPKTMQQSPKYGDVITEIRAFFKRRLTDLEDAGLDPTRIILDPGLGFGKTAEHNLEILRRVIEFRGVQPVMIGPSRKAFLGKLAPDTGPQDRLMSTAAVVAHCALSGVELVRVHDVKEMRRVANVCAAIQAGRA